jgi:predicted metal-dependent HD superfamily phosphohydrolase
MVQALRARFMALFDPPAGPVFDRLAAAYGEPARRYHTLDHIAACLGELDRVSEAGGSRRLIELALWWHDAIYDAARADNEALSAELAERDLQSLGEPANQAAEIGRLIRLTKGHAVDQDDRIGAVMISIDLSVLGQPKSVYDRYAGAVRAEYGHLPHAAFRHGRAAVLKRFLATKAIFPDPAFRRRLEGRARLNIARELQTLEADG